MLTKFTFRAIFLMLFVSCVGYSQTYIGYGQASLFGDNFQQNNIFVNYGNNFGLSMVALAIDDFRNSWESSKRRDQEQSKFQNNLRNLRERYTSHSGYPESIQDGWHLVMVTDNFNYCSEAKVLVEDNEIKKFYIDNFYPITIKKLGSSKIRNGRVSINITPREGVDDSVEVFFIYDLDQPFIVERPLRPGYISIYSDLSSAKHIEVWIDDNAYGELSGRVETTPDCVGENTMALIFRPGKYHVKALGKGSIKWNLDLIVKEDECLLLNLNKENRQQRKK